MENPKPHFTRPRLRSVDSLFDLQETTTKDDKVEIVGTLLGSFILGASFAKEFFAHGKFEIRIFLFGMSCFVLLTAVSLVTKVWLKLFDFKKKISSCLFFFFFFLGSFAAYDIFQFQFLDQATKGDLRFEAIIFLSSYTVATNLLYYINKQVLLENLRQKTIYKYILAPTNGLSLGVIITGVIVWWCH